MDYFVYILVSGKRSNWSYVGSTGDLERRYKDHCYGKVKSTNGFLPLKLIYYEKYDTKDSAYERELYLKTGCGREQKSIIIEKHNSGIV